MSEIPSEPTPPQAPQKRRAGAPKGNRNAFKHGRYSAEVLDLRRRIGAFLRRANAAAAAADRLARARTEGAREKARAEVHAAVRGEGGYPEKRPKTEEQLYSGGRSGPGARPRDPPPPENRSKTAEQLSFAGSHRGSA